MDIERAAERKVVRRGMLAALASLGAAAMLKFSGADKASAVNGETLFIGNTANGMTPTGQTATNTTRLNYNTTASPSGVGLDIRHGSTAAAATISDNTAIYAANNDDFVAAVLGRNHNLGPGVAGLSSGGGMGTIGTSTQTGVRGMAVSGAANTVGVLGVSNLQLSDANNGTGPGIGVQGKSMGGPGVEGISVNSLGVRGRSTNFVGVVGISTGNHGLYGSTNAAGAYGIVAENLAPNGPGLLITGSAPSQVFGGLQVFGVKNAVLKMQDGSFASVYCQESPEPYFEDFGRAQLVGGVATVPLEREFATLVAGGDYMVFCFPQGDTKGLFVSRQTPGGFEVREVQSGTGSIPFTYRIVTRRKDIEGRRFARVSTEAAEKVAGVRAMLSSMGTPGAPSQTSPSPAPFVPPVNPVVPTPPATNPTQPGTPGGFGAIR